MDGLDEFMPLTLDKLDRFPDAAAELTLEDLPDRFPNPTLILIEGERAQPLFVSTLLHGNETTSFEVLKHIQREYGSRRPPRSLMVFVGNSHAAAKGVRRLEDGPDFNRIWAGGTSAHHRLALEVTTLARKANLFASIDVHNNTGANPHYGCVNTLRPADLELAALFAKVGVYYQNPPTTQSIAFSRLCPAVTVECGKSGDKAGVSAAVELVENAMRLEDFSHRPPPAEALSLYETIGRVVVDETASMSFGECDADLMFRADLEAQNFACMRAGDVWARTTRETAPLTVLNEHGEDLTDSFFSRRGEDIVLKTDAVPSMVTHDYDIIRQDCLCYLMTSL